MKNKFKEGNIVKVIEEWVHPSKKKQQSVRICILINITQHDLDNGFSSGKKGLHLMRGFCQEPNESKINRLDLKNYSKIDGDLKFFVSKWRKYHPVLLYENANDVPEKEFIELMS
jgi:hypothetical protein